jgi:hypothetical protein
LDDVQRIREAMEGGRPVVLASHRELIINQANIIGEDGAAMVEDIEEAAANASDKVLPADVFKMIDRCMASLSQKVKIRMQSDAMVREREPERLKQIEAIREQATMLHGCRLNRDKITEESIARTMREAVIEYMAAVDKDKEDGLDPGTARLWREHVQEIVNLANLEMPVAGTREEEPTPVMRGVAADCLAPLRDAIDQARYTAEAADRELNEPEETVLRGFGKQLGSSKKEIMALSKSLAVGQAASVATEATRLANEACEAIRTSRESIRAALREMGAASDISEVSGPVRARPTLPGGPSMGRRPAVLLPTWPQRPPLREWEQRPPPSPVGLGRHGGRLGPPVHAG